jgi:uncharacterized protein (TIGR02266 family)
MVDERRAGPRARIAGAKVTCESGAGVRLVGRAVDLGKGGLFVQTNDPMPAGKQVSVELQIPGQLATWSAIGRVRWNRGPGGAGTKPAGMGIAFVDVDNAVLVAIGKILQRGPLVERTDTARAGAPEADPLRPAAHAPPAAAAVPARERTVLGVGLPAAAPVAAAPIVAAAPAREKTMLGVAPQGKVEAKSPGSDPPHSGETTKVHAVVRLPPEASRSDEPHPAPEMPVARAAEARPVPPEKESSSSSLDDKWPDEPPESSEPPAPAAVAAASAAAVAPGAVEPARPAAIEPGKPVAPPVERSLAVDLVTEKDRAISQPPPERSSIDSLVPAGVPRGRRGGRTFVLLLVAAAGVAAYVQRERLRPFVAPYIAKAMALTSPPGAAGATGGGGPTTAGAATTATAIPAATATPTPTPTPTTGVTGAATTTAPSARSSGPASTASAPASAPPSAARHASATAAAAPPPPTPKPRPATAAKPADEAPVPQAPDNPY